MKNIRFKVLSVFVALLFCNIQLTAQQLPYFTQNQESQNPAFISSDYFINDLSSSASIRYRSQWVKVKGAPKTLTANYNYFNEDYGLILGGNLISDQTGPTGFTGLYGRLGYGLELGDDFLLSLALNGGLVQYRVKGDDLNFLEVGDIGNNNESKLFPDFGVGAMLYYDQRYYIGVSVPQTFGLALDFREDDNDFSVNRVQHYYSIVGANFEMRDDSWLGVSSEMRYVQNAPFYFNGRLKYVHRNLFWVSGSMASSKEMNASVGVIIESGSNNNLMRIGYAYSNFLENYGPSFGVSHEIGLFYSW